MSERITLKDLESIVTALNETKSASKGKYRLNQAYGSIELVQLLGDSTACNTVFGFTTKRELHGQMMAFKRGLNENL